MHALCGLIWVSRFTGMSSSESLISSETSPALRKAEAYPEVFFEFNTDSFKIFRKERDTPNPTYRGMT